MHEYSSVFCVRTKLIHDKNSASPKYNGLVHGTRLIIKEEGLSGIYRGLGPVMARQGANSAVRFSCYSTIKTSLQNFRGQGDVPLPSGYTFLAGAIAGIVTVYSTMPLDVIKTRMQGLDAKVLYKNSIDCLVKVVKENGVLSLWKGATPRLARLIVSYGLKVLENDRALLNIYLFSSRVVSCSPCMKMCIQAFLISSTR